MRIGPHPRSRNFSNSDKPGTETDFSRADTTPHGVESLAEVRIQRQRHIIGSNPRFSRYIQLEKMRPLVLLYFYRMTQPQYAGISVDPRLDTAPHSVGTQSLAARLIGSAGVHGQSKPVQLLQEL